LSELIESVKATYKPPRCTSCHKPILPGDEMTSFYCPQCGQVLIWRCSKCRKGAVRYKCVNCGFEGP
jgi:hypothetical protein